MKLLRQFLFLVLLLIAACGTNPPSASAPGNFQFEVSGAFSGTFTGQGSVSRLGDAGYQLNLSAESGQTVTILLPAAAQTGEQSPISAALALDANSGAVLDYGIRYSQLNTSGGIIDAFEQVINARLTLTDVTAPTGTFEFTATLPESGANVTVKGTFDRLPAA